MPGSQVSIQVIAAPASHAHCMVSPAQLIVANPAAGLPHTQQDVQVVTAFSEPYSADQCSFPRGMVVCQQQAIHRAAR